MKKRLIILVLIAVGVSCSEIHAQKITIGAKSGLCLSNFSSSDGSVYSGYALEVEPNFGVYGEYHFSPLLSMSVGAEYLSQGGVKNKIQVLPDYLASKFVSGYTYYADVYNMVKLDYLTIPVLARLHFGLGKSPFSVYIAAGPYAGILLNAHQNISGSSLLYADESGENTLDSYDIFYFENSQNIKNELRSITFGMEGLVGLTLKLSPKHAIFVEGAVNVGLTPIQKSVENGKTRTKAMMLNVGYAYSF